LFILPWPRHAQIRQILSHAGEPLKPLNRKGSTGKGPNQEKGIASLKRKVRRGSEDSLSIFPTARARSRTPKESINSSIHAAEKWRMIEGNKLIKTKKQSELHLKMDLVIAHMVESEVNENESFYFEKRKKARIETVHRVNDLIPKTPQINEKRKRRKRGRGYMMPWMDVLKEGERKRLGTYASAMGTMASPWYVSTKNALEETSEYT
jgi:hypothetical protein